MHDGRWRNLEHLRWEKQLKSKVEKSILLLKSMDKAKFHLHRWYQRPETAEQERLQFLVHIIIYYAFFLSLKNLTQYQSQYSLTLLQKQKTKKNKIMMINSFAVMHSLAAVVLVSVVCVANAFTRNDFPPHFLFGASTSAYQVPPLSFSLISIHYAWIKFDSRSRKLIMTYLDVLMFEVNFQSRIYCSTHFMIKFWCA